MIITSSCPAPLAGLPVETSKSYPSLATVTTSCGYVSPSSQHHIENLSILPFPEWKDMSNNSGFHTVGSRRKRTFSNETTDKRVAARHPPTRSDQTGWPSDCLIMDMGRIRCPAVIVNVPASNSVVLRVELNSQQLAGSSSIRFLGDCHVVFNVRAVLYGLMPQEGSRNEQAVSQANSYFAELDWNVYAEFSRRDGEGVPIVSLFNSASRTVNICCYLAELRNPEGDYYFKSKRASNKLPRPQSKTECRTTLSNGKGQCPHPVNKACNGYCQRCFQLIYQQRLAELVEE